MIRYHYVFIKPFWYYQELILQLDDDNIGIFNNTWNIDNMAINVIVCMCVFVFFHLKDPLLPWMMFETYIRVKVNDVILWKLLRCHRQFPSSPFLNLLYFTCKYEISARTTPWCQRTFLIIICQTYFFANFFEIVWNKDHQSYENKLSAFIGCNSATLMSLKNGKYKNIKD